MIPRILGQEHRWQPFNSVKWDSTHQFPFPLNLFRLTSFLVITNKRRDFTHDSRAQKHIAVITI